MVLLEKLLNIFAFYFYTLILTPMTKIKTYCIIFMLMVLDMNIASAQALPDILYYKFDETGTNVTNLASSPPAGTTTATIQGAVSQGGTGACINNGALIGSGVSSTTDYLNTGWAPDLGTSSWTIAWWSEGFGSTASLYYIFGDVSTNSFRCFTNGVAGTNNWILRGGGLTDVLLSGGALSTPTFNAFVYDNTTNQVKAYLNGVLVNTVNQGAPNITGTGPLKVMGYNTNVGAPAGGKLDEFRIYRRALSDTEIAALMQPASLSQAAGALPSATLGANYSQTITQTGLGGTITWSVSAGALPDGLSLNTSTGEISGTPSTSGTSNFTIQATNGNCTASQAYSILTCPAITITPNTLPNTRQNQGYNQTLTQTGLSGTVTWSIIAGTLPNGLSLNTSTGQITGTATTLQTANFTIQVSDGTCSSTKVYTISVDVNGAVIEVATTDIDFGDVLILQSSRKNITVKNIGVAPLVLSSMSMPNVVFNYGFIGTASIAPNESRDFEVSFTPTTVASYNGTITVNSNAVGGINTFTVKGNGINPTALNNNRNIGLKTYPNPVNNVLNVTKLQSGIYNVRIYNVVGKELRSFQYIQSSGEASIDMSEYPSGLYLIELIDSNKIKNTVRVVKQ